MKTQTKFIGLFVSVDEQKGSHVHARAVYEQIIDEDWENPTIKMGTAIYYTQADASFRTAFDCVCPAYKILRDKCIEADGMDPL